MKHKLLACGIVAGPMFIAAVLIQAFTRPGFDLGRHPLSLLSLGDLGWVQVANFILAGALYLACAVGVRRALYPGRSSTWGPLLVGLNGLGLIVAGVFVTDPGAGFPPGAPAGAPEQITWHGILHEVGFILASLSWVAACLVFLRRFAAGRQWGWVAVCAAAPAAVLVVDGWPHPESLSVRLLIGSAIAFGYLAVLAARLRRDVPGAPTPLRRASAPQPGLHARQ